MQDIKKRR